MGFIISANVCFNITSIIKNNVQISWDINIIKSVIALKDINLLFGTSLLSLLIDLFILKYNKGIKLKYIRKK